MNEENNKGKARSIWVDEKEWNTIQKAAERERQTITQYLLKAAFDRMEKEQTKT